MKRPSAKEAATGALLDANFRRRTEAPPARQHAFQHVVAVHEMVLERARDVQGDQESHSPGGEPMSSAASENPTGPSWAMFGMRNRSKNRVGTGRGDVETTSQPGRIAQKRQDVEQPLSDRCQASLPAGRSQSARKADKARVSHGAVNASAAKPNDL